MKGIVDQLREKLPEVLKDAKFNENDYLAVLQGIVGFAGAVADKNPLEFIGNAVSLARDMIGKRCPLGVPLRIIWANSRNGCNLDRVMKPCKIQVIWTLIVSTCPRFQK